MAAWSPLGIAACFILVASASHGYKALRSKLPSRRLPPGPPAHWLFGNLFDMPRTRYWETYTSWAQEYGPIVHVRSFGITTIVVSSAKVASDLMVTHSAISSDRPRLIMARELMGWDHSTTLMPNGDVHRKHRRALHYGLSQNLLSQYYATQEKEIRLLLSRLLAEPAAFVVHMRRAIVSIIMTLTYGHEVVSDADPFIALADEGVQSIIDAGRPGAYMVDYLPLLKYVPDWFPFTAFKQKARAARKLSSRVLNAPYEALQVRMHSGTAKPCYVTNLLEHDESIGDTEEHVIRATASAQYGAGVDTTVSASATFVLAMVLFPDVQRKAQEELNRVIGGARLPTFSDRSTLPYVGALVLEIFRWQAMVPIGIPHRLTENLVYDGFWLPKGAIVTANQWAMLHDATVYSDPFEFKPERFLGVSPEPDPRNVAFGFGRRECPGRYLAENTLWIEVACILAVFEITKALDQEGNPITPDVRYTGGLTSHPEAFTCSIKPRSTKAWDIVEIECVAV